MVHCANYGKMISFAPMNKDGKTRADVRPGQLVNIVLKKDQRTGALTQGIVRNILTSAPFHHRGIKVRLDDGQIGRIQEILPDEDL
jgi:uncharacterized repeat protein (TIGR03833 family)